MYYVVGAQLPFPGWFFEFKNEYHHTTLLMSLTDEKCVSYFRDFQQAMTYAGRDMFDGHSSPRTNLPLGMRAVFEVTGDKKSSGEFSITKITKVCLPHQPYLWKELDFDTSQSIYQNSLEKAIYGLFYSSHISLKTNLLEIT